MKSFFSKMMSKMDHELKNKSQLTVIRNRKEDSDQIGGIHYIKDKIILSPFPKEDIINALADYLDKYHHNQYLVYNISEFKYNNQIFGNSVMEYQFPGVPCPPLYIIYIICSSISSWLDTDSSHVVVLHCQETKGRSILIAACFLAYYYLNEYKQGVKETIKFICKQLKIQEENIFEPSHK